MDLLIENSVHDLSVSCMWRYNHVAFDGCSYYFTLQNASQIIQTNREFKIEKYYDTNREYDCICYDYEENCFWVSSLNQSDRVYKLNRNLCEIDYMQVGNGSCSLGNIKDIAFACNENKLLVAYANAIYSVDIICETVSLYYQSPYVQISSVCSLCPATIITGIKENTQYLYVLGSECCVVYAMEITCERRIRNIIYNPCCESGQKLELFALKKGCYPYMYIYEFHSSALPFALCECLNGVCNTACETPTCEDSCCAVMESIAMVECSIANILQAESQKITKILGETSDVDEILRVNNHVKETITHATQLEFLLYSKLQKIIDCCGCNPCKKNGKKKRKNQYEK